MNTDSNDILAQNINGLIEWIKQPANATGCFTQDQTPLYVQEYINWYFWSAALCVGVGLLWLVVSGVSIGVGLWALRKSNRVGHKYHVYDTVGGVATGISVVTAILGLVTIACFIPDMVKAKIAPRFILLDEAARIVNKVKL